ncbi:MAG: hypothetical protein ABJB66_19630 [Gemmatimonadaceae bacterium]
MWQGTDNGNGTGNRNVNGTNVSAVVTEQLFARDLAMVYYASDIRACP